jgi:polyphenol oxidase
MNVTTNLFYQSSLLAKYNLIAGTTFSNLDFSKKTGDTSLQVLAKALNISCDQIKIADQGHTSNILEIPDPQLDISNARVDSLITQSKNIVIGVKTADCIGLIIYDPTTQTAATVHLGRKGVIANLLESTIALLQSKYLVQISDLVVYFAPSLKPQSHSVFESEYQKFDSKYYQLLPRGKYIIYHKEMFEDFIQQNNYTQLQLRSSQSALLDLDNVVIDKLTELGIDKSNIELHPSDTFTDPNFHSFRRDYKNYGHHYSFVYLK